MRMRRKRLTPEEFNRNSERTRRLLYDLLAASYFRMGPPRDEEDTREWRYGPEDVGLEVFYLHGRWFAKWTWPEGTVAPDSRGELVRLEVDQEGELVEVEV